MNDLERLITYYAAGRVYLPLPRYLCFNATLRCDGRCAHCGIWRDRSRSAKELDAHELAGVLAGPLFGRIETAWITGGEPTLREDLGALARAMTGSLPRLQTLGLATNGLDPERVLERVHAMLAALVPGRQRFFAHVSLDGVGEVHDRVRGKPGAFGAVSETISRLLALGREQSGAVIELGLNCVIQPGNVEGLDELFSFARKLGLALTFNVALVTDRIYRNRDAGEALTLCAQDRKRVIEFLERVTPASPAPLRYQYRTIRQVLAGSPRPRRCLTLYTTININADGALIPCPAGSDVFPRNVMEEDVERLWQSRDAAQMRRRIAREFCPGCMLSCSLGDSMPLSEWLKGGWNRG